MKRCYQEAVDCFNRNGRLGSMFYGRELHLIVVYNALKGNRRFRQNLLESVERICRSLYR